MAPIGCLGLPPRILLGPQHGHAPQLVTLGKPAGLRRVGHSGGLLDQVPTPTRAWRHGPLVILVPENLAVEALRAGRFKVPAHAGVQGQLAGQLDVVLHVRAMIGL